MGVGGAELEREEETDRKRKGGDVKRTEQKNEGRRSEREEKIKDKKKEGQSVQPTCSLSFIMAFLPSPTNPSS